MACASCGAHAVELIHQQGGTDSGNFVERYECTHCGATGTIRGDAGAPAAEWSHVGTVLEEPTGEEW